MQNLFDGWTSVIRTKCIAFFGSGVQAVDQTPVGAKISDYSPFLTYHQVAGQICITYDVYDDFVSRARATVVL